MTKIAVDKALIEQALDSLEIGDNFRPGLARVALRAALAEPAVEPSTDDSSVLSACQKLAQAFKTSPPPAEPARTSQDVCTVPLLSDEEMWQLWNAQGDDAMDQVSAIAFARAIEQAVRRKAGL